MKPKFLEILEHLPEARPRSRLDPYKDLIRELRQRQRSYREITHLLAEHCGVQVCHSTLHEFVSRYLMDKQAVRASDSAPQLAEKVTDPQVKADVVQDQGRGRIAALKRKPAVIQDHQPKGFQFDGSEPLRLRRGKS